MTADAPVVFVCAMPMELRPLTKLLGLEKTSLGGGSVREGTLDGRRVVAAVTGMGTQLASQGMKRLLDAVTPRWVVVVGITGAVDDELFRLSRQDGTPDPKAVIRYIVRHPGRIPRLARMGKAASAATTLAANAAVAAVRASLLSPS